MNIRQRFALLMVIAVTPLLGWPASESHGAVASPTLHEKIVSEYLDGKWDEAEADLASVGKDAGGAKTPERADLDYIKRTMDECRPAWWKQSKAGKKFAFRPTLWGHTQAATFDPAAKTSLQLNFVNGRPSVTVMWDTADMDNPVEAEHGFSKGELIDLSIWEVMGMAESWMAIPLGSQRNLNEGGQLLLSRYLDFRANLAGDYYGTPRARRWGLWLQLAAFTGEYAKLPTVMSRKAVGALFMQDVLAHANQYPSIKLPASIAQPVTEEKLADHLRGWIEKHGLTLAEDRSLREAVQSFAAKNTANVRQSAKVLLPSGLVVWLDPDADKADSPKRDAWIVTQLKMRSN